MNRIQFEQWKNTAMEEYEGKLNKLKKEIEEAHLMFSRMEHTLVDDNINAGVNHSEIARRAKVIKQRKRVITTTTMPSAPARMLAVREKIHGEFARSMIFDLTNSDGGPTIPKGTMAPVFAGWIKDGTVKVVKEPHGSVAGTYIKAEEHKPHAESSPAVQSGILL